MFRKAFEKLRNLPKKHIKFVLFVFLFALIVLAVSFGKTNAAPNAQPLPIVAKNHVPVCPGPGGPDNANCHARVVADKGGHPLATTSPTGYSPEQFRTAYNLPSSAIGTPIIAIVDAYDNPNAYSDLSYYSSYFGLPVLPQCVGSIASSAVPCFKKINQSGGTTYPNTNSGWALEIALDIQVAHAICPNCKILL